MSIQLGLVRIQELLHHLPTYRRPTIHLVGTNGKGSVSALLTSILHTSSISVGRFNSPHLVHVYDCIYLNNAPVDEKSYTDARQEVEATNELQSINASLFEILTATALLIFERAAVDVVVLEAGMGGAMDATNSISDSCVLVSALSAVDLDHQAFLGNTVAEITRAKSLIVRKDKPFILGFQKHTEVETVAREVVEAAGGKLHLAIAVQDDNSSLPVFTTPSLALPQPRMVKAKLPCFSEELHMQLPLHGDHQLDNLGLALSIISSLIVSYSSLEWISRINPRSISRGVSSVVWRGRLSFHQIQLPQGHQMIVLADGAHNAASALTLASYLNGFLKNSPFTRLYYVLSLSHSPPKMPAETLSPLFAGVDSNSHAAFIRFSQPAFMPWVKSVPPSELQNVTQTLQGSRVESTWAAADDAPGGPKQVRDAFEWIFEATGGELESTLVVVAGSLYLVADLYRLLKEDGSIANIS